MITKDVGDPAVYEVTFLHLYSDLVVGHMLVRVYMVRPGPEELLERLVQVSVVITLWHYSPPLRRTHALSDLKYHSPHL